LIIIAESLQKHRKIVSHPANAGLTYDRLGLRMAATVDDAFKED